MIMKQMTMIFPSSFSILLLHLSVLLQVLLFISADVKTQQSPSAASDAAGTTTTRPLHLSKLLDHGYLRYTNRTVNAKDFYIQHELLRPIVAGMHHTVADVLFVTAVATCNMSDSLRALKPPPITAEEARTLQQPVTTATNASSVITTPVSRVRCRRCTQSCYEPCVRRECASLVAMPPAEVPKYLNINKALLTSDECQDLLDCNILQCQTKISTMNASTLAATADDDNDDADDVYTGSAKLTRWKRDLQCLLDHCAQTIPTCSAAQFVLTSCFLYQCSHDCIKTCAAGERCSNYCSVMPVDTSRQFLTLWNQWRQLVLEANANGRS